METPTVLVDPAEHLSQRNRRVKILQQAFPVILTVLLLAVSVIAATAGRLRKTNTDLESQAANTLTCASTFTTIRSECYQPCEEDKHCQDGLVCGSSPQGVLVCLKAGNPTSPTCK